MNHKMTRMGEERKSEYLRGLPKVSLATWEMGRGRARMVTSRHTASRLVQSWSLSHTDGDQPPTRKGCVPDNNSDGRQQLEYYRPWTMKRIYNFK